jgi:hypothetical protein
MRAARDGARKRDDAAVARWRPNLGLLFLVVVGVGWGSTRAGLPLFRLSAETVLASLYTYSYIVFSRTSFIPLGKYGLKLRALASLISPSSLSSMF